MLAEVVKRLGRTPESDEIETIEATIEDAEDLAYGWLGTTFEGVETPRPVIRTIAKMVVRAIERDAEAEVPVGVETFTSQIGPVGSTYGYGRNGPGSGPWLTQADKTVLRPYRAGRGFASLQVTSGRTGRYQE